MWSAVVLGTHPIEDDQDVWLEISADDVELGPIPAYWIENKGVNSLWHVPIPPQAVAPGSLPLGGAATGGETAYSPHQNTMVRPNLPDRTESAEIVASSPEGLVGNRRMTAKVDARGSTYDVYFPDRRAPLRRPPQRGGPAAEPFPLPGHRRGPGGRPTTRLVHRAALLGVVPALSGGDQPPGDRADLAERADPGLDDRLHGDGRQPASDGGGTESPGQYLKRFRVKNEGSEPRRVRRLYPGRDQRRDRRAWTELARPYPPGDQPRPRARQPQAGTRRDRRVCPGGSTIAAACEPTGATRQILLRWLDLPAGEAVTVDLLVSGAFTGWRGDPGRSDQYDRPWPGSGRPTSTRSSRPPRRLGRLRRAAADPELPQSGLCRGLRRSAWRSRSRRCHLGGDRLGVRSRIERLLLPARGLGRRGDRAAGPSRDRPRGLPVAGESPGPGKALFLLVPEIYDRRWAGGEPGRGPVGGSSLGAWNGITAAPATSTSSPPRGR